LSRFITAIIVVPVNPRLTAQPVETYLRQKLTAGKNRRKYAMPQQERNAKLRKMKHYIDSLCGIYSRIARRLGVDRTYVRKVAKGERRSPEIELALIREFDQAQEHTPD
jgi:hypothetical protein